MILDPIDIKESRFRYPLPLECLYSTAPLGVIGHEPRSAYWYDARICRDLGRRVFLQGSVELLWGDDV